MSETQPPKLANLISIVFILSAIAILLLGYLFFLKPLSAGPSMSNLLSRIPPTTPELLNAFIWMLYIPNLLSIQLNASNYLLLFTACIIIAIILIVSAFGFAYRKKWGYYLTFISSLFLIITPAIGYLLGFPIIYVVGSVFIAIIAIFFILYLRGNVKEEFK
ncbi:MAG: hypothetical protein QXR19_11330 [Candidatus Jordarchaeaceae archaeon]